MKQGKTIRHQFTPVMWIHPHLTTRLSGIERLKLMIDFRVQNNGIIAQVVTSDTIDKASYFLLDCPLETTSGVIDLLFVSTALRVDDVTLSWTTDVGEKSLFQGVKHPEGKWSGLEHERSDYQ